MDFYLPKLGVCLERFGWYNKNKKALEEYEDKVRFYIKKNIPTVILYSRELGFLNYAFHNKTTQDFKISKT